MAIVNLGFEMSSRSDYFFTSESVSEGHPDKVCDRISDAVLDAFLTEDPEARVACETFATTDRVVVGGEVRGPGEILGNIEQIVRDCVKDIGYEQKGFHWANLRVHNYVHGQSEHIAQGVDAGENKEEGAGDQGIMFGYATDETPELMPAPIHYSHAILRRLSEARKSGAEPRLGPDAKAQLSLRYAGGKPVEILMPRAFDPASRREHGVGRRARDGRALHPRGAARGLADCEHDLACQSYGQVCYRRTGRRRGADRAEDHRRHLWRRRTARRRGLLGQGSDQGGPLGRLCRAIPGEERGGRGPRQAVRAAALICHRRGEATVDLCRHPRDRPGRGDGDREGGGGGHGFSRRVGSGRSWVSTVRSTSAPRPMAISGARRTTRAASPGSGPT